MSKSEYARLEVQIPDVVKVIREQVLDALAKDLSKNIVYDDTYNPYGSSNDYVRWTDITKAIENLNNK